MARQSVEVTGMSHFRHAVAVCPPDLQTKILQLSQTYLEQLEEIRFRLGQPLQLCGSGFDVFLGQDGGVTMRREDACVITDEHLSRVVQTITQSSLYAVEEELKRGFVTIPGGHRVGVAGRVVLSTSGGIQTIRNIASVNVRIAREKIGIANQLVPYLCRPTDKRPHSALVISPPQCGKTTLLRDLARGFSTGWNTLGVPGMKVGVVDERSEIAGCVDGIPQFHLGPRTDVLDACPKAQGMLMMIRSLSPEVLVTDEIGRAEDKEAIVEAAHAGVAVLASAHATSLAEWRARPNMGDLFTSQVFTRYVILSRRRGAGTIEQVLDAQGKPCSSPTRQHGRLDAT